MVFVFPSNPGLRKESWDTFRLLLFWYRYPVIINITHLTTWRSGAIFARCWAGPWALRCEGLQAPVVSPVWRLTHCAHDSHSPFACCVIAVDYGLAFNPLFYSLSCEIPVQVTSALSPFTASASLDDEYNKQLRALSPYPTSNVMFQIPIPLRSNKHRSS